VTPSHQPLLRVLQPALVGPRCRRCAKGIVWPGLCYTCATALPRRLRRADEPPGPWPGLAAPDQAIGRHR
jgi:hypothetical protein